MYRINAENSKICAKLIYFHKLLETVASCGINQNCPMSGSKKLPKTADGR